VTEFSEPAQQHAVSVVIPVYGSGGCLAELLRRADAAFQAAGLSAPQFVLVDDNGPGDAWSEIRRLAADRIGGDHHG
jgi:hypothetical protein